MGKEAVIEAEGIVVETLPHTKFTVKLENGHHLLAHISGKMRMHFNKIAPGDKVSIQMSPYDFSQGRIVCSAK